MDGIVIFDGGEHLIYASSDGVHEIARIGSGPTTKTVLTPSAADALAVGRVGGARIIAAHVEDHVRIIEGDGATRDVALPPGRADVRGLVIDAEGRVSAVRESVMDTLEPGSTDFIRTVLVGRMHASSAVVAADGDGFFVVGEEGQRGVVVRVTKNGQQTFATTETRIWRAWASKSALWGIDARDRLYRIDLTTRTVRVEQPDVGPLTAISGIETAKGDLVVVTGQFAATFDGKTFGYPSRSTAGASSVAIDAAGGSLYITDDEGPKALALVHPWIVSNARMFSTSLAVGPEHGPIQPATRRVESMTVPSFRLGYGYGWNGKNDSSEFDAAAGLRIGLKLTDEPHVFFWPEAGYTASSGGRFAMLGAGAQWGNVIASTGPAVRGLLGYEESGSQAAAIRSSWHSALFAGLLNLEIGHQLVFAPGGPRHEGRALASVDLLAGGGLLIYLGIPLGVLSGILLTEALR